MPSSDSPLEKTAACTMRPYDTSWQAKTRAIGSPPNEAHLPPRPPKTELSVAFGATFLQAGGPVSLSALHLPVRSHPTRRRKGLRGQITQVDQARPPPSIVFLNNRLNCALLKAWSKPGIPHLWDLNQVRK
jgi:hypothetical protein